MPGYWLTDEEKRRIVADYRAGMEVREIASAMGRDRGTIRRCLKEAGVFDRYRVDRRPFDLDEEEIRRRAEVVKGETLAKERRQNPPHEETTGTGNIRVYSVRELGLL